MWASGINWFVPTLLYYICCNDYLINYSLETFINYTQQRDGGIDIQTITESNAKLYKFCSSEGLMESITEVQVSSHVHSSL